jgi:hypothetical protein
MSKYFWRAGAKFQQNFKSEECSVPDAKTISQKMDHTSKKSSPNLGTFLLLGRFLWPVFSTVLIVFPSLVAINVKSFLGCLPPVLLSPKY